MYLDVYLTSTAGLQIYPFTGCIAQDLCTKKFGYLRRALDSGVVSQRLNQFTGGKFLRTVKWPLPQSSLVFEAKLWSSGTLSKISVAPAMKDAAMVLAAIKLVIWWYLFSSLQPFHNQVFGCILIIANSSSLIKVVDSALLVDILQAIGSWQHWS